MTLCGIIRWIKELEDAEELTRYLLNQVAHVRTNDSHAIYFCDAERSSRVGVPENQHKMT